MQLKTITNSNEAPFPGVEFIKTDKNITEVVIGGKLRIRAGGNYSNNVQVLVETPHVEEKRWKATAEIEGFGTKTEYFAGKYEADSAFPGLEEKGASVSVVEVNVLVDENGNVAGEVGEGLAQSSSDDLPF